MINFDHFMLNKIRTLCRNKSIQTQSNLHVRKLSKRYQPVLASVMLIYFICSKEKTKCSRDKKNYTYVHKNAQSSAGKEQVREVRTECRKREMMEGQAHGRNTDHGTFTKGQRLVRGEKRSAYGVVCAVEIPEHTRRGRRLLCSARG